MPTATKRAARKAARKTLKRPSKSERKAARKALVKSIRASSEVAVDLEKAQRKLADAPFMDARYDKAAHDVTKLQGELEFAQLREMPEPPIFDEPPTTQEIDVDSIDVNGNHRLDVSGTPDAELERLARSIRMSGGLIHPIGVRAESNHRPKLIWGSRRLAAAKLNKWKTISARLYPAKTTDEQVELLRTIENFDRKNLTPVEEALGVARVIDKVEHVSTDKFLQQVASAGGVYGYVALALGHDEKWVRDRAYVHKLGGVARKLLASRRINVEHARELAKLGDPGVADKLADEVARNEQGFGGKDVNYLRQRVLEHTKSLRSVPWRLNVAFGKDEKNGCMGWACESCVFNTKSDPVLFETPANGDGEADESGGVCTNEACFGVKMKAAERDIAKGLDKARDAVKQGGLAITETALANVIPVTIRGNVFVRRAKVMIEPETGKLTKEAKNRSPSGEKIAGSSSTSSEASAKSEIDPQKQARATYTEKLNRFKRDAAEKIAAALKRKPGRLVYFLVASYGHLFDVMQEHGPFTYTGGDPDSASRKADEKARRVAKSGQMRAIFKKLANPTMKDLVAIEKNGTKPDAYNIARLVDDALIGMAEAMGVDIGAAPDMPEEVNAKEG